MAAHFKLESTPPDRIVLGKGFVHPFSGWAFHPHKRLEGVELQFGTLRFQGTTLRDVRTDVFSEFRGNDPRGHSLACGFWGLVKLPSDTPPGVYPISLCLTWNDGSTDSRDFNRVTITLGDKPCALGRQRGSEEPLIAICMATYNPTSEGFEAQVKSIKAQTYGNWICLIQDDHSSQRHWQSLREMVGDDPRFKVEQNEQNLGFYKNFERCLARVPQEAGFVALADQDDIWYSQKLEVLHRALSDGALLAYSDAQIVDEQGGVIAGTYWTTRRNQFSDLGTLLLANTVTGAASLFRRDLLDVALPFPPRVGDAFHDHWIACCALATGDITYVEEPLYDYIQHGANALGYCPFERRSLAKQTINLAKSAVLVLGAVLSPTMRQRARDIVGGLVAVYCHEFRRLSVFAETLKLRVDPSDPSRRRALDLFDPARRPYFPLLGTYLFGRQRAKTTNNAELRLLRGAITNSAIGLLAPLLARLLFFRMRRMTLASRAQSHPIPGVTTARQLSDKVAPLQLVVDPESPVRVNIVIPELGLAHFFGGYIAKINLGAKLIECGHQVRFLLVDQEHCIPDDLAVIQEEYSTNKDLFQVAEVQGCLDRTRELLVSPRDRFIATTWWTAHITQDAVRRLGRERFLYLIQEYEPFTFKMGSYHALAHASYAFPHDALFSSRLLADFFEEQRIGVFAPSLQSTCTFRIFENAIMVPHSNTTRGQEGPCKLLFYARPEGHAARNLFEIGYLALEAAVQRGLFSRRRWQIFTVGSDDLPEKIASDFPMHNLGKMNLSEYQALLPQFDLGMSLMYTPHPSLVPIEMAAAGMVVLTTTCLNKTADTLKEISPNLIGAEPTIEGVMEGLERAVAMVEGGPVRTVVGAIRWAKSWDEALSPDVMEFVQAHLSGGLDSAH